MSGGGGNTSVQTSAPWSAQKDYLLGNDNRNIPGLFPQAAEWYQGQSPQYYPGQTVADFSPEQQAGMEAMFARGANGSPLTQASNQYYQDVLSGKYTDAANPYF